MESVFGEKKFRGVGETRTISSDLAVCGIIAYWKGLFLQKNNKRWRLEKNIPNQPPSFLVKLIFQFT